MIFVAVDLAVDVMAYDPGLPHLFPRTCSEAVLGYQKRKLKSSQYETIETVIKRSASGNEDPVDVCSRIQVGPQRLTFYSHARFTCDISPRR